MDFSLRCAVAQLLVALLRGFFMKICEGTPPASPEVVAASSNTLLHNVKLCWKLKRVWLNPNTLHPNQKSQRICLGFEISHVLLQGQFREFLTLRECGSKYRGLVLKCRLLNLQHDSRVGVEGSCSRGAEMARMWRIVRTNT